MYTVALALFAALLFGAALVSTQFGLRHGDALSGARVSIPAATAVLWVLSPLFFEMSGEIVPAAVIFAVVGLFYPAAVTLLNFEANRRMGPTIAGTVGSITPLFAVVAAVLFLDEPGSLHLFGGCMLVVLGTAALCFVPGVTHTGWRSSVLWLPLAAAILRAIAQVLSKAGLAMWPNPFTAALIGYTVSTLAVWQLPRLLNLRATPALSQAGKRWFALTGLLNGGAVLVLYVALLQGTVGVVSPIVAVYPVFTLALSAMLLRQERLGMRIIAGVALTVAGVIWLLLAR